MAFQQILVPLLGYDGDKAALEQARQIAGLSKAQIFALHVKADALSETPLMVDVGVALSELMEAAERHIAKRAQSARGVFDAFRSQYPNEDMTYREERGQASDLLSRYGRLSDLTVIGRPVAEDALAAASMEIEHVLFGSGHPVLLVPGNFTAGNFTDKSVLVSWNGSVEATHAVGAALPLLKEAKRVVLLSVMDKEQKPSAKDLSEYLARHGIHGEVIDVQGNASHVPQQILDVAHKEQVGMILMGAYTHSRLRQLILGGATSYMIEKADLPVLMMH